MESTDEPSINIEKGVIRTADFSIPISQVLGVRITRRSESAKSWFLGVGFIALSFFLYLEPAFYKGGFVFFLACLVFLGVFIGFWPQIHDQHRVCVSTPAGERVIAKFDSFSLLFYDSTDEASAAAQQVLNQVTEEMSRNAKQRPVA